MITTILILIGCLVMIAVGSVMLFPFADILLFMALVIWIIRRLFKGGKKNKDNNSKST